MPNLINVIMKSIKPGNAGGSQAERNKRMTAEQGMEWGTCMIFTCERDCTESDEKKDVWREEVVVVQWDR
jgi:pre-rRNA-processing protein TSR4